MYYDHFCTHQICIKKRQINVPDLVFSAFFEVNLLFMQCNKTMNQGKSPQSEQDSVCCLYPNSYIHLPISLSLSSFLSLSFDLSLSLFLSLSLLFSLSVYIYIYIYIIVFLFIYRSSPLYPSPEKNSSWREPKKFPVQFEAV